MFTLLSTTLRTAHIQPLAQGREAEKGLRQTDFAKATGVDKQTVSNWEAVVELSEYVEEVTRLCKMLEPDHR